MVLNSTIDLKYEREKCKYSMKMIIVKNVKERHNVLKIKQFV